MKIIKQFDDFEFFCRLYEPLLSDSHDPAKDMWRWGFGDDGQLYYQSTEGQPKSWYPLRVATNAARILTLQDMKRLVKEFGHLLTFL
jgi:hypothetical protein